MINLIELYIPKTNKRTRPGTKLTPTSITIHETDNENIRANARAHALLQFNGNSRQASWHLQVDDESEVYLSIPLNEIAFHAGNRTGNMTSIAIEICVNKDGNYLQAIKNASKTIQFLQEKYPSIEHVYQHHHWSKKNCPRKLRKGDLVNWTSFLKQSHSNLVINPINNPYSTTNHAFRVGAAVYLKQTATHYATGETISGVYKGKKYTVQQKGSNRILLKEIFSWVKTSDLELIPTILFKVNDKVRIKSSAQSYSRSRKLISYLYKNKTYTVQQVSINDILIRELYSWVKKSDVTKL